MDSIDDLILRLTAARGAEKSICPSEVARALGHALGEPWQSHLKAVRARAVEMARAGRVQVLRKGRPVEDLDALRGVIRLRMVPQADS